MKTVKVIGMCALLLLGAVVTMSFAVGDVQIPSSMEEKVLQIAVENNCITQDDATFLADNKAMEQCVNAFISSGFDPSAVVDKIAELGVESGKFSNKEQVKATMKATAEKMRKNESNWAIFYNLLGL